MKRKIKLFYDKEVFMMLETNVNKSAFFHLYNDYLFKKVFASDNTLPLLFLINSVVSSPIHSLSLLNGESLSRKINDKRIYQDIKSKDDFGNIFNVEMQNTLITSVQEDRFLFTGCKNISGQLHAGQDYSMIKKSETIVLTNSFYDSHLLVTYQMHDVLAGRSLKNKKLLIHYISLPAIDRIVARKEITGEALTDLEIICFAVRRGIHQMTYDKANDKQKKVLMVMEESLNALHENPLELTRAEEAWFYQMDLIERERLGREEGLLLGKQEGLALGKKEGLVLGKQEGLAIGEKQFLIKTLSSKFGSLSQTSRQAIMNASSTTIDALSAALFQLKDESDLLSFFHIYS